MLQRIARHLFVITLLCFVVEVRATVVVPNFSFETPVVGTGNFQGSPSGGSWTFGGGTGVNGNGGGYASGNANAPNGVQVAYIQGTGNFTQTLTGFSSGISYTVRFAASQRNFGQAGATWDVTLDGIAVGSFSPPQSATTYVDYTVTFTTTTGSHSLGFKGTRSGDNSVLIDNVRITEAVAPPPTPTALVVVPISGSQLTLKWEDAADNETGFKIERKMHSGGTYAQIATVGANVTLYQDTTGLIAGTNFYYRVRATNNAGDSTYSNEAVGTPSSTALPTADYQGRPFVTQAAPVLPFTRQLAPRLTGIDYTFAEQTARGVALLSRFPAFTLSDRRVHVDGPWYNTATANLHFTRGITSIGAMPNYRLSSSAPTTLLRVPSGRKWQLMTDPLWYIHANLAANQLASQNASDARIPALRAMADQHVLTNDEAAFRELGRQGFEGERWATDINGEFTLFPCLDIETTGNFQYQRNCYGWIYQGMAAAAAARGVKIRPMLYGQYQYDVGCFDNSNRQGGVATAPPDYLRDENDFLATADPTIQATQDNHGILSMDGYMQAMWGRAEPFYKRNADGSLQLSGGLPVFNNATTTTAYGINLTLEAGEAQHCLHDIYRQAARMYIQHHRRAGQYPSNSTLRKSFLTNCSIGAWGRYTNEGVMGIEQNDRPLPDWEMDMVLGIYLFTADDIVIWSSDMNFVPGALGANYSSTWQYNAHGVLESVVKPLHRYSALDPIHSGDFQWCWFSLPVVNQNSTAGERYFEKPIAMGKLRQFEGNTWLEMFAAFPALDGKSGTMKVWVDKNGTRSSAYTVKIQDGRSYFLDAWQLPSTFTNLEGKHIIMRFTDLLGVQRTWTGDWRVAANNTIATPADYTAAPLTGFAAWQSQQFGAAAGGAGAQLSADPDADGLNNLFEYALSSNPQQASAIPHPDVGILQVGAEQYLTLTFTRNPQATDTITTVQVGTTPTAAFNDGSHYGSGGDVVTNGYTTQVSRTTVSGVETITVRDNLPLRTNPKRLIRLRVSLP